VIADAGPTAMTNRASRLLAAAFLIAVAGAAWWQTIEDAHGMAGMLDGFVKVGRAMPWDVGPVGFAGTWTVMMAAMMLPAVIPVVMAADELRYPPTRAVWAAGYLGVWASTGAIAFGALVALNGMGQPSAWLHRAGGALFVLAGVYQFTACKRRLLHRHDADTGVSYGLRCVGASWALMSVLLVVGVMNIAWMAAVSAVCLGENLGENLRENPGEKASPRRTALATGVGAVLIACGLVVLIEPSTLDVIAGTS
jgi:predicted metal-binding membrane protein